MKEIVVLSGKGGTGKTSIVGSLAAIAESKVLADCDVDAADLHLLLNPSVRQENEFWSGYIASIDQQKCTQCGLCEEQCRFDAIENFEVDAVACEGCAFCSHICPVKAITMQECMAGHWFLSDSEYGPLVHARLGVAQENSGKLVALVRKQAREIAHKKGYSYIICDGPPGIGCPVISSLSGADVALLVTEPTLSGIHDMERIIAVCKHFDIPSLVCINKYDINIENSKRIEQYCRDENITIVARIAFDTVVTEAMIRGLPVVKYSTGPTAKQMYQLWQTVISSMDK
jgi:MinD superfamily P-loop ATPase